jgi:DNA-directed RNA polymerase subunit M/transcription elongation factor TFIIS
MKDDLVDLYLKRYGEILNMSYVDQLKEEVRALQAGEITKIDVVPSGNLKYDDRNDASLAAHNRETASAKRTKIKLKALLMKDDLVEKYLEKYGEIINPVFVEQLKKEAEKVETGQIQVVNGKAAVDPIYKVEYQCPACNCNEVIGYSLRSKSQAIEDTIFLVPQYSGISQYFAVDFNLLQTTVCPRCLYASPDPKDWKRASQFTGSITESQLVVHTKLLAEIRSQEAERKSKFPEAKDDPNYFHRPRDYKKALESIVLSVMRAELEKKHSLPAADYKIARYYLKIADIKKKNSEDYKPILKEVEKYFTAAAIENRGDNVTVEMECIYQVIALNLYFGNKEKAAQYIKMAKDALNARDQDFQTDTHSTELKAKFNEADKWVRKIDSIWEYRDEPDFWAGKV